MLSNTCYMPECNLDLMQLSVLDSTASRSGRQDGLGLAEYITFAGTAHNILHTASSMDLNLCPSEIESCCFYDTPAILTTNGKNFMKSSRLLSLPYEEPVPLFHPVFHSTLYGLPFHGAR